ncbi:hypothetical protein AAFF_G00385510 [Aldrovandia affinis]|uniref:Uncharacterized protein n=1 Tax=Aldrovandia affinis TaxID=143900 RepID=A0AAD7SF45_9TELE|nr:hypothetical protein AAFF_G00385510 [Aldrovandia affinis]
MFATLGSTCYEMLCSSRQEEKWAGQWPCSSSFKRQIRDDHLRCPLCKRSVLASIKGASAVIVGEGTGSKPMVWYAVAQLLKQMSPRGLSCRWIAARLLRCLFAKPLTAESFVLVAF